MIIELYYQDYLRNQTKYKRFIEIPPGKVDFKDNVIYLRDLTVGGGFQI